MCDPEQVTPTDLNELQEAIELELDGLHTLNNDEKKAKLADIKEMISYYTQATAVIEDRRAKVHAVSLQLLGISVAGCALVVSAGENLWGGWLSSGLFVFALVLSVSIFIAAMVAALVYETQSGFRYPFLKLKEYGNRWKWFYHGNPAIRGMNRNAFRSRKYFERDIGAYLEGLKCFVKWYREEDIDGELRDAILHLYLLQVHNYYKNRWYLQLTVIWRIAFWGIFVSVVGFILYAFTTSVILACRSPGEDRASPKPSVEIRAPNEPNAVGTASDRDSKGGNPS